MAEQGPSDVQSNKNNDTLVFAHVIFRHGQRSILETYATDPYKDDKYWPDGFGQLTNEGKRQLYRLGQFLRRRYGNLIGKRYSLKDIYVQSTDFDRTLMSAQSCLAGLYPPTDEQKWSDEILWQPIPVHTTPCHLDHVLATGVLCPKYEAAREKYLISEEVTKLYAENADLLDYLSKMSGEKVSSIIEVNFLYNTLSIEKERFGWVPDWAEKVLDPNGPMANIAKHHFKVASATPLMARFKSGFLIKDILERFTKKIFGTLEPNRSLWIYSAHDDTISNALNTLRMFELHLPPYAASLHFELYSTEKGEYYIQIFYRKENEENLQPLNIPGCGEKCTLEQFYDLYEDIIPDDFEKECIDTQ